MTADGVPFLDLGKMHEEIWDAVTRDISEVIRTNAFIGGPWVEQFESSFAEYCGTAHCIGVANGTDALALILRAIGVGPGDEVIVPANTFIATAEAVLHVGARPVYADVEPSRLLMTAETVAPLITERTAACIVVHLFGLAADMVGLSALCDRSGIALIEDAAQAHGAQWAGGTIGSFGVAAGFSFYPGKNLGAFGDGGAITTNDPRLAEEIFSLINHGRSISDRYLHERIGVNSRLDGLQAAVLSQKLALLDTWNAGRRAAHARYLELLQNTDVVCLGSDANAVDVHHLEVVRVADRSRVIDQLTANDIGTGIHYPVPCHLQPAYLRPEIPELPVATDAAAHILSLPMFPHLTPQQVERVCEILLAAV